MSSAHGIRMKKSAHPSGFAKHEIIEALKQLNDGDNSTRDRNQPSTVCRRLVDRTGEEYLGHGLRGTFIAKKERRVQNEILLYDSDIRHNRNWKIAGL